MVKVYCVKMPDGWYKIPASCIAQSRANYYKGRAEEQENPEESPADIYKEEYKYTLENNDEIVDWAQNNMNWSDVKQEAIKYAEIEQDDDFQEAWVNGEHKVRDE